ncbi:MAG: hypothetical protein JWM71_1214, partial [Solirubrobacteraceae bacterium]|nr:hypothetical protein [Solirubrobacteraceae bacterium]
ANPMVVVDDDHRRASDGAAGRVGLVDAAPRGSGPVTRMAQWQSAIGFRTCFAGGLGGGGFGAATAFLDRRYGDALSHVFDTFDCCPNHDPDVQYLYAAFAPAPPGRR